MRRHRAGKRGFGAPAFWLHLFRRKKVERENRKTCRNTLKKWFVIVSSHPKNH